MKIDINPEKIFRASIITALVILFLHLTLHWWKPLGMPTSIFYADEQVTLSGFFSVIISSIVGLLFIIHAGQLKEKTERVITYLVGLIFFALAFDEYTELHGFLNDRITDLTGREGAVDRLGDISWIFPLSFLILAVVVILVLYISMIKNRSVRLPFVIGLLIFLLVLPIEILGGQYFGKDIYVVFVGLEEGLEMVGQSFFLLSVLKLNKTE